MAESRVGANHSTPFTPLVPPRLETRAAGAGPSPELARRPAAASVQGDVFVAFKPGPSGLEGLFQAGAFTGLGTVAGAAAIPQLATAQNDKLYDGHFIGRGALDAQGERQVLAYAPGTDLTQVPGFEPRGGLRNDSTLIYVNGVSNNVFDHSRSMQALAEVSGSRVVGIHNSTEGGQLDLLQAGLDKLQGGKDNPAVRSVRDAVLAELRAGRPVHLVGHSQGALILSAALQQVKDLLDKPAQAGGPADAEAARLREQFNQVKVETYGGAATSYPPGPQYVHYINTRDPVSSLVGLPRGSRDLLANEQIPDWDRNRLELQRRAGGPGAVVNYIDDNRGWPFDFANHEFNAAYVYQRVEFDQAQRGEFRDVSTWGRPPAGSPEERYDRDGGEPVGLPQ